MTKMKGITCCGDCGYYNWKKHKCTRATDEGDARDNFYADCPLPDVVLPAVDAVPVVRCKDCKYCYFASNRVPAEQTDACIMLGIDVKADWFCAYGERRDGDT